VSIQVDLRSYEFGTFYGDIVRGKFQMFTLRWIGGNNARTCSSGSSIPAKRLPKATSGFLYEPLVHEDHVRLSSAPV